MHFTRTFLTNLSKLSIRDFSNQKKVVYLTHVKWVTGRGQIEKYFSRFGKVEDVSLFFDPDTGLHRGYASVEFQKPESALEVIQKRPHVIDGDLINVEFYMPNFRNSTKYKTQSF
uniref:RRM domain-containing protein n=1 Tax=Parastrongyloides trichosuri TaxID=131310 RepID=A0A0N4Z8Q8_PARTI